MEGPTRRNVSAGGCEAIYRDINSSTGMTGVRARQQPEHLKLPPIHSVGHRGKEDRPTSPLHMSIPTDLEKLLSMVMIHGPPPTKPL